MSIKLYNINDIPEHLRKFFKPAPQIGLEPTPDVYVAKMVEVFREVRRVLRDDGTLWLNVGDSYASSGLSGHQSGLDEFAKRERKQKNNGPKTALREHGRAPTADGLKPKDLCLIPWRLALALQADGWYVRSVICWAKKSPMPESVTDRPTNSWEPIFLLAKNRRYFYDSIAVQEPATRGHASSRFDAGKTLINGNGRVQIGDRDESGARNQRNVWAIPNQLFRMRSDLTPEQKEKLVAELLRRGVI